MKQGSPGYLKSKYTRIGFYFSVILLSFILSRVFFNNDIYAATFTVNSQVDASDGNLNDEICESVPGSGICTLRAALEQSNALAGADIIQLPPGNYQNTDTKARAFTINDDVELRGSNAATTVIDGQLRQRVFWIIPKKSTTKISVTLSGLTIRNGVTDSKGIILNRLTIEGLGAGILAQDVSELVLRDVVVQDNKSDLSGSGLYIRCKSCITEIQNSVIENNGPITISSLANYGGGLFFYSDDANSQLNISNSTFRDNTANSGAGLFLSIGITTLLNSTVSTNTAKLAVGDLGVSARGGGITVIGIAATVNIINSTVSGNVSDQQSAGIEVRNTGKLSLYSSTIVNNQAALVGGGLYGVNLESGSSITMINSIIANNRDNGTAADCAVSKSFITSNGYNLIGDSSGCNFTPAIGDLIGDTNQKLDAGTAALANNGGLTTTHALQAGSLAIDSGDPNGCIDANGQLLLTDQRGITGESGVSRATDGGKGSARCDIGAFELSTRAPIANAGSDIQVKINSVVQLDGSASRAINGISSYLWRELQLGTAVILSDATLVDPVFTTPEQPIQLTFELVVTDVMGLVANSTVQVSVNKATATENLPDSNANENTKPNTSKPATNGGCSINKSAVFDPLLLLLFLLTVIKLVLFRTNNYKL